MKKIRRAPALAVCALAANFAFGVHAITTNDIQLWTGSGSNRAALVIEWNSPQVFNNTTVPGPAANKTLVWGYQFNGAATGTQMLDAVLASDHRLYAIVNNTYGTYVEGLGYNLSGNGLFAVTDGDQTYSAGAFSDGCLLNPNLNPDAAQALNGGDLFWSGYFGPNWNVWNELGDSGGFPASPNRGTDPYWNTVTGIHGQWEFANEGLDDLPLYDGSWIGFSVAAAGYDTNSADPATAAFNDDEQAPPSPDGTYAAYIVNTNDFAAQIVNSSGLRSSAPYDDPGAVLGPPTLSFVDIGDGGGTNRMSLIDPPYNVAPDGSDVIAVITNGGQITVKMGRKVYHNSNNPYGVDLLVYGNSFFTASGVTGPISDLTDLESATLGAGAIGHDATISVSPDGTNWYAFDNTPTLFPANAYRWDPPNHSWTDEASNPTKPIEPSLYLTDFSGQVAAGVLDQFAGAAGGTGYNLSASGFPWILYVRIEPATNTYTVIDAIAAVNPTVEGGALAISPEDVSAGTTNLVFQKPEDASQTVSANFASLSQAVEVSTVELSDFSSFAPVPGSVIAADQITVTALSGTTSLTFVSGITLSTGIHYTGDGSDLRVLQWSGTNWNAQPFVFDAASGHVTLTDLTNLSAFVVTRLSPQLSPQLGDGGFNIPLTPFTNVTYTLQRSTDLMTWTSLSSVKPASGAALILDDPNPPVSQAFYRLLLNP